MENCYIVSYLGEDPLLQKKRLEFHNRQLDWILETSQPSTQIKVFDQNYKSEWKRTDSKIEYYNYSGPVLKQWKVRNIFYQDFYQSNDDLAVFLDNDTVLYDHFDGKSFFKFISEKQQELVKKKIYCFVPIDAAKSPFNQHVKDRKDEYDNNFVFNHTTILRTCFYCMLNLKKHFNREVYFRDFSENEFLGRADDYFFSFDLMRAGFKGFKSFNFILKDMVGERYSLLSKDNEERNKLIGEVFDLSWKEEKLPISTKKDFYLHLKSKYLKIDPGVVKIPRIAKNIENEFF